MIGSHNTFSFAPVKQWYLRPIKFMGRCQRADIFSQFAIYNVRYFDLRLVFNKKGELNVAHGIFHWDVDIDSELSWLNLWDETVYVRVILEQNSERKNQAFFDEKFIEKCKELQEKYKRLIFVGGNRKYDWAKLYDFNTTEPTLDDRYSSTTRLFGERKHDFVDKLDDLWPWLYAKIHNKELYSKGTDKDVLFLDFVDIKNA